MSMSSARTGRITLVCVVGTSTSLTYWAFGVAAHAMEEAFGAFHRIHCVSIEDFSAQWRERGERAVLFTTDLLDERLSALLCESGAPIIALADTAELAILTAAKLRQLSFLGAVRLSSLYISSLQGVFAKAQTRVFASKSRAALVRDFVPRFLEAMRLTDNPALVERVLRRVAPDESRWSDLTVGEAVEAADPSTDSIAVPPEWSAREIEALLQTAADYQQILDRRPLQPFVWPAALLHAANPEHHTELPLQLVGPARLLVWGPYMHLPKGKWSAAMEFEVEDNVSGNSVVADILIGGEYAGMGEFNLPRRGIFTWKLDFEVKDVAKSIEVRLTLGKSAIEGTFFLRRVRLNGADPTN